ncbi:MFS transporter [Phytohabitans flavus]|uniref:MFS transporter n=1 Tax=Phytohabitans flavus TaxID=1076124 RepID=A0A6F8Y2B4_9ACTN|nr:MFS transporter [Phytohabitans flavus]BCB80169.1 MFS transporter [Phytohabitans flavus]
MRSWLRETAGGLPTTFWYLWTGTLVNRLGSFVIIFMAIYLTSERHFTQTQAGLVIGLFGLGSAAGVTVGGVLADRWGRRPTLLTAHLGAATMLLAMGFARDLWTITLCALVLGFFMDATRPAFQAMMVDVVPERDRLRAFSLNYWAINLGFAFAAVLAGLAAQADFLLLFVVDATTTVATAAIIFAKVRETRRPQGFGRRRDTSTPAVGLHTVFADRVFVGFLLLNLLSAVIFLQHISMLPIAMGQDGLSPSTFGWVIALNGVLIVAGQLFVPRLIRGRDRSRTLAVASLVTGLGFGLTAAADAPWLYAVTVLIWTMGEMLTSPSNATLIAELSPSAIRGRYQGVFSLSWSGAAFLAPTLGGFVMQHGGNTALWLGTAGIGAAVAVGHILSGPSRERRVATLAAASASPAPAPPAPAPTAALGAAVADEAVPATDDLSRVS